MSSQKKVWPLVVGDALAYALVVLVGFVFHREPQAVVSARYLATYLPLLGAWLAAAAAVVALDPGRAAEPAELWRPAVAALLAAPLGAVVRGAWLGTPVLPIFVAVIGAMSLCAVMIWRVLFLGLARRRRAA